MDEVKISTLPVARKLLLAGRIVVLGAIAERELAREPLPGVVARWGKPSRSTATRVSPYGLGRAVSKVLGRRRRCVVQSLVLHRLLSRQGDRPNLVIGIPGDAANQNAHAWIELDGKEIGPPPGRSGHLEMARFA